MGQPRAVAEKCELVQDINRAACMHGVVYALVDNTWDGRYALPLRSFRNQTDREDCFDAVFSTYRPSLRSRLRISPVIAHAMWLILRAAQKWQPDNKNGL